ncbi:hypothetical protein D3C84_573830 [compost metagenome]
MGIHRCIRFAHLRFLNRLLLFSLAIQRRLSDGIIQVYRTAKMRGKRIVLGLLQIGYRPPDQLPVLLLGILQGALFNQQLLLGPGQLKVGSALFSTIGISRAGTLPNQVTQLAQARNMAAHGGEPLLRREYIQVDFTNIQRSILSDHQQVLRLLAQFCRSGIDLALDPPPVIQPLRNREVVAEIAEDAVLRSSRCLHLRVIPVLAHIHLG